MDGGRGGGGLKGGGFFFVREGGRTEGGMGFGLWGVLGQEDEVRL